MPDLTPEGQRLVRDLAARHGVGEDAVSHLLAAMVAGHGRAAQFTHPELGGAGQWMSGGMLMIGNLFDGALKARVGALCEDVSTALAASGPMSAPAQSQTQGGDGESAHLPGTPFLVPSAASAWWPRALGTPSASGAQGATRYAYFADARRLVVDTGAEVRVHDTLDHRIGGFSQGGGGAAGLSMSSQHGTVDPGTLPVVSRDGRPEATDRETNRETLSEATSEADPEASPPSSASSGTAPGAARTHAPAGKGGDARDFAEPAPAGDDPLRLIERLGGLRDQGLLTDEEFAAKKRELLARL